MSTHQTRLTRLVLDVLKPHRPGALTGRVGCPLGCRQVAPRCGRGVSGHRRGERPGVLLVDGVRRGEAGALHLLRGDGDLHRLVAVDVGELVGLAKLRWRIERDYQELKQELGLGNYEGRGWRGFHHHATLCIAAYGFLISEQETISPSAPRCASLFTKPVLPAGYRPRGAADPARTPHSEFARNPASPRHRLAGAHPVEVPLLQPQDRPQKGSYFKTQQDHAALQPKKVFVAASKSRLYLTRSRED